MTVSEIPIRRLKGYSEAEVWLMRGNEYFVRKSGEIERNLSQIAELEGVIPVVPVLRVGADFYDMPYVQGLDVATYLARQKSLALADFLKTTLEKLKSKSPTLKDYGPTISRYLKSYDRWQDLCFIDRDQILAVSATLPSGPYHGDLTLENVICFRNQYQSAEYSFILVDPLSSVFDSWVFDLAKLRQDVSGLWFLRHAESVNYLASIKSIERELESSFAEYWSTELYTLMLMRVFRRTQPQSLSWRHILGALRELWT